MHNFNIQISRIQETQNDMLGRISDWPLRQFLYIRKIHADLFLIINYQFTG